MKSNRIKGLLLVMLCVMTFPAFAQRYRYSQRVQNSAFLGKSQSPWNEFQETSRPIDHIFFNVDWQVNGTINNDFAGNASGWGANFEAGYYLTEHWALGAFIGFHTNNEYFPRETFMWNNVALTTDQQHSLYQLPFGVSTRYRFINGLFAPYIGLKMGAQYSESESYINDVCYYNHPWGFYVSPEVGMEIHPFCQSRFGFHIAAYYNHATNDNSLMYYQVDGLNNYGFRLGIAF